MNEITWFVLGGIVGLVLAVAIFNLWTGVLDALKALVRRK